MPKISEKELESYIFDNYNNIEGLEGNHIIRQLKLQGYGRLDLLVIDYSNELPIFKIIELKENKIDYNALGQISRYMTALKRNLREMNFPKKEIDIFPCTIKGILIGKELELNGDICYVTDQIPEIEIIIYNLNLENGVTFDNDNSNWFDKKEKINYNLEKQIRKAFIKHNNKENGGLQTDKSKNME